MARGRDGHGIFCFRIDEGAKFHAAFGVITGDLHDVVLVLLEQVGIFVHEGLLHSVANGLVVVLGFEGDDGYVRFVIEDVVSVFGLVAGDQSVEEANPAFGEVDLFPDLRRHIPPCQPEGGRD